MTEELRTLCSATVEGTLTPEQTQRLEVLVQADPAARRFVVEYLNLHASLKWAAGDPQMLANGHAPSDAARSQPKPASRSSRFVKWTGWIVAASLLVGVGIAAYTRAQPQEFARLVDANGCKWESGTLPTESGARLGTGRLRLAEGVARFVFDNGAELRLEGPADLELQNGNRCTLHSGRLVARCPETARGFFVDTPSASLKDLGTEFGVSVTDGKTSDVQVFEGRVDVTHGKTGQVEQLLTGRGMRFTPESATPLDPKAEGPRTMDEAVSLPVGQRLITISTASGKGKDGYVAGKPNLLHSSDVLLLVKCSTANNPDYHRKAYVGLDLAPLVGTRVQSATLTFAQTPTGMGFASEVPDSTFSVYGVTDEKLNDWPEDNLLWESAPGNAAGGAAVNPAKTRKVGQFQVRQGVKAGVSSVSTPELAEFLNSRKQPFATFILARDTVGSGRNDYVHGFAGRDHPTLPPPTLKLVVAGRGN
ncbi:MAG: iron dicitrate transport regulator FecR [Planctomycetaceae bacterium]|nr:iron dicitrate transport regulator FecR [Planctomycetaceae bacterium]